MYHDTKLNIFCAFVSLGITIFIFLFFATYNTRPSIENENQDAKAEIRKVELTIVEIDRENFIKKGLIKVYLKYPYQSDFIKDAILLKVEEFSDNGWSDKNVGDKAFGLLFIGKKIEIQTITNQKINQDK